MMIHLGMRRGQVGAHRVRDLDEDGGVVWIQSGKTRNALRRLKVSELLSPLLRAQTAGEAPDHGRDRRAEAPAQPAAPPIPHAFPWPS